MSSTEPKKTKKYVTVRIEEEVYSEIVFFTRILSQNHHHKEYKNAKIQQVVNGFLRKGLEELNVPERRKKFAELTQEI